MCIRVRVLVQYMRVSAYLFARVIQIRILFFVLVDSDEKSIRENDICPPVIAFLHEIVSNCGESLEMFSNDFDVLPNLQLGLVLAQSLKDNDQCGRYCVNDLADVSKMRLRVAGCSRDRFVITTLYVYACVSSGGLRLTERRTNKQRERACWSSDLSLHTLREAVERNCIKLR